MGQFEGKVNEGERKVREKATQYLKKLKDLEKRPKKKMVTRKVAKKGVMNKLVKKAVRTVSATDIKDKKSQANIPPPTRASSRTKSTTIIEKSKQLVKKAVQKSKQKIKTSPVALRRALRPRTKANEEGKEDATSKEKVENVDA